MKAKTVLVTGAGSGFGQEVAFRLAEKGYKVIASVEIVAQKFTLEQAAQERGVKLLIEKLDISCSEDRQLAENWDVDILLNNAGISEGGSVVDIPEEHLRKQFEVNVFGTILLTQIVARKMIKKKSGKIIIMSSVAGLTTDPFAGCYSASKHALEAFAAALNAELKEFGVDVATVNPGPFMTGFNDRMFETWQYWQTDPKKRAFDYKKLAFPHKQMDPEDVFDVTMDVITGKSKKYRNIVPLTTEEVTRKKMDQVWDQKVNGRRTKRHELVQKAYDLKPATPDDGEERHPKL